VNLEAIGKVAELVPTSSPFKLGLRGKPKKGGIKPFVIVGRLQLSTGQGTWDEWHIAFEDGKYGWLAEAQGQFYITRPLPPPSNPPAPEFSQLQAGMKLNFGAYGTFTVTDRRQALYASAEGELPFSAPPGAVFMYADLSASDGGFATLDYGDDPGVDAFFVGKAFPLADLGIEGLTAWSERKVAARAASFNCPNCGGGLNLKDPMSTVRIACQYCGSLLGTGEGTSESGKFEILERMRQVPFKPDLPLGAAGTLFGHSYVILGALVKSCDVEGTTYFWREYLLKETTTEEYHWLVESNGHWSVVQPVAAGKVEDAGRHARYEGRSYKHFQRTHAKVEAVLGEFYWEVAAGEVTEASDYVAPPRILSMERTGDLSTPYAPPIPEIARTILKKLGADIPAPPPPPMAGAVSEINWSEGTYVEREELTAAFALTQPLPDPTGVGSNQPWPKAEAAKAVNKTAWILMAVTFGLMILFNLMAPKKVVYEKRHDLAPLAEAAMQAKATTAPGEKPANADDLVILSEPFEIPRNGNVEVRISAPSNNNWIGFDAALIEDQTGNIRAFYLLSDYYHGSDGGESWSEGSSGRSIYLSQVEKGRYVLRLEPEWESPTKVPAYADVRLRCGVPRTSRFFIVMAFLLIGPIFMLIAKASFESRRWSESDYAGGS
jgi:DNA-directed RNA polymerase subunit RPC12/RpoP